MHTYIYVVQCTMFFLYSGQFFQFIYYLFIDFLLYLRAELYCTNAYARYPPQGSHKFPFWQLWARRWGQEISLIYWLHFYSSIFDFWLFFHPFPPFFLPQGEVSLSFWDLQYYTMILCRSCRMGRFQEDTMSIFSLLIFSLFTCKIKFKKMFLS